MAKWARTNPETILLAVLARLAETTELDESRIILSIIQPEDVPTFAAFQDVVVRAMSEMPDSGAVHGAGRHHDLRERTIEVSARTRVQLDQTAQALAQLTDATLGHLILENLIVEALQEWLAPGSDGDVLTAPMEVGRLTTPARLRTNPDWVCSTFTVNFQYVRDLDLTPSRQIADLR